MRKAGIWICRIEVKGSGVRVKGDGIKGVKVRIQAILEVRVGPYTIILRSPGLDHIIHHTATVAPKHTQL